MIIDIKKMLFNLYITYYFKKLFSKRYIFIKINYKFIIKEIYNLNSLLEL